MIVDCFPFFNEIELLELRLELLAPYVDYFVLAEGNLTHSGKRKPRHFLNHERQFKQYEEKIVYVDVDLTPYRDAWAREFAQRDALGNGLQELGLENYDLVISSDVDEIPDPRHIQQNHIGYYQQRLFSYYVNLEASYAWVGPLVCTYKEFMTKAPSEWRSAMHRGIYDPFIVHEQAGWHFTSLGGTQRVAQKLQSYAHQEYNTPEHLAAIERRISNQEDVFGRGEKYTKMPPPWPTDDWLRRYPDFMLK